ncbi:MAG: hypothetical protein IJ496_06560 [Ruminococcus sp.]|nr:hypothetical protein [Ruminococcus sp.]
MRTRPCDEYISNRAWFRDTVGGENLILRGTSALEYLELFDGYTGETEIDVYAKSQGHYENINYHVIESFDEIEHILHGNVLCSTFNQTVNDMLQDENSDEQALCEALSNYYFAHNESFDELKINPENTVRFNTLIEYAMEYYSGG